MARILRFDRLKRRVKAPGPKPPLLKLPRPRSPGFRLHRGDFIPISVFLALLALFAAAYQHPLAPRKIALLMTGREQIEGIVHEVIDGDSLVVGRTEIRLTDFDAPEFDEPGGALARGALFNLVYGKEVTCVPCEGAMPPFRCRSYDRVLATCRLDGVPLGAQLRKRGIGEGGR